MSRWSADLERWLRRADAVADGRGGDTGGGRGAREEEKVNGRGCGS